MSAPNTATPSPTASRGYVGAQYAYRSSAFLTTDNSSFARTGAYGVTNLQIGTRIDNGRLDLSFWVRNLFDTHYLQNVNEGTGTFTTYIGDPMTLGVTLRAKI